MADRPSGLIQFESVTPIIGQPHMALPAGTRLGPYEILAPVGAGGMGEVYRATDTNLGRQVAIKVLPESVARDPKLAARLEREARTLARLNHPNIAAIHGLERSDGVTALVMELVEGPTLADRIASGALPVDEVLPIARQIADALGAAHEQGIIHRDLKPANIKVRPDGTVKVLDFGLAKALQDPRTTELQDVEDSPTITSPAISQPGLILGTAAYMSPEQAVGKPVDRRTDLWAFGVVLYEMLAGVRPFNGVTLTDTLTVLSKADPDWTRLPGDTPAPIRLLLRRCLDKEQRHRLADASDARLEIEDALSLGDRVESAPSTSLDEALVPQRVMRQRIALAATLALLAVGATAGAMWLATRPAPLRVVELAIPTTPATEVSISGGSRDIAITPDGSSVVYAGGNGTKLFLRPLDALEPLLLHTGGARGPFISPDGRWVGFNDSNTLKKVSIAGGPAVSLATLDGISRGAVWLPDDTIIFATDAPGTGLQQVAAGGGAVTVLTRQDRSRGERDHLWPEVLPGGRSVLFTILPTAGGEGDAQIAVLDLDTRVQTVVVRGGSHASYVAGGYLLYAAGDALRAVAFDPAARKTRGTPVPVVPEVVTTNIGGGVDAVMANDGTLAYIHGIRGARARVRLAWVDRQDLEAPIDAPPRPYIYPRVSPDGKRLLVFSNDQENDLWGWDVARSTLTRLTFTPELDLYPVWALDGKRLFFSSDRDGARNLYVQVADGTGTTERLTQSVNQQNATGTTPDGTQLLFWEASPQTGADVLQVALTGSHLVMPLVKTPATERNGVVSPDGRWLAYEADDSGALEVYVRPYPDVAGGRWQVSTGGGTQPLWSRDGRELFYVSPAQALMRVSVGRGTSWTAAAPTRLLKEGSVMTGGNAQGRNYDIAPDGQRFLVLRAATEPNAPQLVVVQHFDERLRRLVPAR